MDSIPARLRRNGTQETYKSRTGYAYKKGIEWILCSFEEYYRETLQAAKSLHAMGVHTGKSVAILSFNRPEWVIADVACMMTGGIPAGIYQTCSPVEVQYIIHHSESSVVFVAQLCTFFSDTERPVCCFLLKKRSIRKSFL